jgi:hypothetical protein
MALSLAVRRIDSPDLGYHLACGDHFLDHGEVLRDQRFYYTELDPALLADPARWGPSSWYDAATGTYRFVNVNWLSQVVMAAVHRASGMEGLSALQIAMFAALLVPLVVLARRNGTPWLAVAVAVILVALTAGPRIPLRPEGFGYLVLAVQWCLLAGPGFGPRRAAAVTLLQVVAANVHSYFVLGVALAGAMAVHGVLEWRAAPAHPEVAARKRRALWLSAALLGTVVAPLANPWFVRGAVMPLETISYMRRHGIGSSEPPAEGTMMHPWAAIRELRPTLDDGLAALLNASSTATYLVCLVLALLAAAHALRRRAWGWALALLGMSAVSLQMSRNLAVFAVIAMPPAAALLADWGRARRGGRDLGARTTATAAAAVAVAALLVTASVVDQRFYLPRNGLSRFGLGVSRLVLPVDAAAWIDAHDPPGRVWCDYDTSSNLMYLTRPHRETPVTTGTWTFPPEVMVEGLLLEVGRASFAEYAGKYDVQTVVFSTVWKGPTPLMARLIRDPDWAIVDVGVAHVILARRSGAAAALAAAQELRAGTFDVPRLVARAEAADPAVVPALGRAVDLLLLLEWEEPARQVCGEILRRDASDAPAHARIARAYLQEAARSVNEAARLEGEGLAAEAAAARDVARAKCSEAEESANRALAIDPTSPWAPTILLQAFQVREAAGRPS